MSRAFKNRQKRLKRTDSWRDHSNDLCTPRSKKMKALRALWKSRAAS